MVLTGCALTSEVKQDHRGGSCRRLVTKAKWQEVLVEDRPYQSYWQIPVAPEDVHKTAFMAPDGQYEFTRMQFGIVNSGATLVRGLRKILERMPRSRKLY